MPAPGQAYLSVDCLGNLLEELRGDQDGIYLYPLFLSLRSVIVISEDGVLQRGSRCYCQLSAQLAKPSFKPGFEATAMNGARESKVQNEKTADLERAPSCQDGVTTIVAAGVDNAGYRRQLSKRQIMMMTFGAGIGTGLWVGTGTALKYAGPGGVAVAYTVVSYVALSSA